MKLGITMLIHNKDDIEFVTEFSCFLGHPVWCVRQNAKPNLNEKIKFFENCLENVNSIAFQNFLKLHLKLNEI